jgi:hypothetical protein
MFTSVIYVSKGYILMPGTYLYGALDAFGFEDYLCLRRISGPKKEDVTEAGEYYVRMSFIL